MQFKKAKREILISSNQTFQLIGCQAIVTFCWYLLSRGILTVFPLFTWECLSTLAYNINLLRIDHMTGSHL